MMKRQLLLYRVICLCVASV